MISNRKGNREQMATNFQLTRIKDQMYPYRRPYPLTSVYKSRTVFLSDVTYLKDIKRAIIDEFRLKISC